MSCVRDAPDLSRSRTLPTIMQAEQCMHYSPRLCSSSIENIHLDLEGQKESDHPNDVHYVGIVSDAKSNILGGSLGPQFSLMKLTVPMVAGEHHRIVGQQISFCIEEGGRGGSFDEEKNWGVSDFSCRISEDCSPKDYCETKQVNKKEIKRELPLALSSDGTRPSERKKEAFKFMIPVADNGDGNNVSKEGNYSVFKTWAAASVSPISSKESSTFDPEAGNLEAEGADYCQSPESINGWLPARRYFDALQGPEFEILKKSEEDVLLPTDKKWPFLLRFPVSTFGICLGLGSQAVLWKLLHISSPMRFLHVPSRIHEALWSLALLSLVVISATYAAKCVFYFEAVRREYFHPVRVNFFFAPWIACMFLSIGVPPPIATSIHPALFFVFMTPVLVLELRIYGQWLSGGYRRLSKVANPSLHLSIVGNFVGARLGAMAGQKEAALFFWAVGLAHYLVLFVTLYQRLPSTEALPRELHPVFFLFIAAPSAASVAWAAMTGEFDQVSRICYFVALFLFTSLLVRINHFRGIRFSVAWWAYTFPTTSVAVATIKYAENARNEFSRGLVLALSILTTVAVCLLFVNTVLHAFVWGSLFPNDMAIAITRKKKKKYDNNPNPNHSNTNNYSLPISNTDPYLFSFT